MGRRTVRSGYTAVGADMMHGRNVLAVDMVVCSAGSADCRSWGQCVGVIGRWRSAVTFGGGMT